MIKVQYTSTDSLVRRLPVLRVCAMFEELTEFCFVFRFVFRANLLDFTSRIKRLHFCCYSADALGVLADVFSEFSRARTRPSTGKSGHRQRVCVAVLMRRMITWPISCSRSTVQLLGLSTNKLCCALVRNSLQTSCLQ